MDGQQNINIPKQLFFLKILQY